MVLYICCHAEHASVSRRKGSSRGFSASTAPAQPYGCIPIQNLTQVMQSELQAGVSLSGLQSILTRMTMTNNHLLQLIPNTGRKQAVSAVLCGLENSSSVMLSIVAWISLQNWNGCIDYMDPCPPPHSNSSAMP